MSVAVAAPTNSNQTDAALQRLAAYARTASRRRGLTEGELAEDLAEAVGAAGEGREAHVLPFLESVVAAFSQPAGKIQVDCDPGLTLPLDELATLGIATAEAIANALAYAFPASREGLIWVKVKQAEGRITLAVRDNGIGLIDLPPDPSRGRGLVSALARRLEGYARMGSAPFGGGLLTVVYPRKR